MAAIEQPKVARGRGKLPDPFYYLNNFQTVLASIDRRYAELLSPDERQFIAHFRSLPRASGALLVRMVTGEGSLFLILAAGSAVSPDRSESSRRSVAGQPASSAGILCLTSDAGLGVSRALGSSVEGRSTVTHVSTLDY